MIFKQGEKEYLVPDPPDAHEIAYVEVTVPKRWLLVNVLNIYAAAGFKLVQVNGGMLDSSMSSVLFESIRYWEVSHD